MSDLNKLLYNSFGFKQNGSTLEIIVRNISNILNTRSSLPVSKFLENQELSTIHFGIPSFTHLAMESEFDRNTLCRVIEKSIQIFEHRLSYVEVVFSQYDSYKKEAKLSVKAVYRNDDIVVNLILKIAFWEFVIDD